MLERIPKPIFILALLAVFALGLAFATNGIIARKLSVAPDRLAAAERGAAGRSEESGGATDKAGAEGQGGPGQADVSTGQVGERKAGRTRRLNWFLDPIVRRNLFDSSNALAGKPASTGGTPSDDEARKSDLDVVLIATSSASDAVWSTALMAVAGATPELYRIGDGVLDAELVAIEDPWLDSDGLHHPGRVIVVRDAEREYIEVGGKPKAGARRKGGKSGTASKKPKKRSGRHKWDGITDLGGGKYQVDQSEIDYALANLDKLSREARIVPNFQDGAPNGFKVFSIRRTSALRKMGLKNNDVLTSVNGFDLSNTEKALEIYSKLQSDKNFSLEVLRNGEPQTLEYTVQ
ncbi:MAG: type II secretion system protein GspC [Myxococcota bacterium]|nr:type II secretion system protein GspC [Myxococcota bacterium]